MYISEATPKMLEIADEIHLLLKTNQFTNEEASCILKKVNNRLSETFKPNPWYSQLVE